MNLKQMTVFREVMLTGSVSEAARNLNRTQPSVSHMIATLEDKLGMRLFERRRGRLHPVPEAQYLFEECKSLLTRVGTVSQTMKRMKAMESGELQIVSMPGPASVLLPELICHHLGEKPSVQATVLSRSSDAVFQLVGSQQFDLGIADHEPERAIEASLISSETFIFDCLCAVPSGDPLANEDVITPETLSGQPMATLFEDHRSFRLTKRAFQTQGAELKVRFITQFFLPLLSYVEKGLAYAIVDPLTVKSWRLLAGPADTIAFLPFRPTIPFGVDILTPSYRPASLLAKSFAGRVVEEFAALGGRQAGP